MKKSILSFAILASGLILASCANKESAKTTDSDSAVATEAVATAPSATQVNLDLFSVDVPQGWKVEKASSFNCKLQPEVEPESEVKSLEGWYVDITIWSVNDFTLKETVENWKGTHEGGKQMEPLTFGGIKFQYYYDDYQYARSSLLVSQLPDNKGLVDIKIVGYTVDDPTVKAILESFKLK